MGIHQRINVNDPPPLAVANCESLQLNSAIRVEVVQDWEAFDLLETQWCALEKQASGATFFQSFSWCAINARQMREDPARRPYVCCAYEGDELVAILPLAIIKKPLRKVLTGFAEPFQEFTDMLALPGADAADIYQAMHRAIMAAPVDYLHLGQVRQDSVLAQAGKDLLVASGEEEGAPYVVLSEWENFDAYLGSRKSKTRKNMRNAVNGLEKTGFISHLSWKTGDELNAVVSRTFAGRGEWLKSKGLSSSAFCDDGFWQLLQNVMSESEKSLEVIGFSFQLNDKPLAEQWGFVHGNRYYAFLSNWNIDFHRISPGRLQLGEILKACFEEKFDRAEFMLPAVPYKMTWADDVMKVQDYVLPISFKGQLFTRFWLGQLRPLAKAAFHASPKSLRQVISKIWFSGHTRS